MTYAGLKRDDDKPVTKFQGQKVI